MHVAPYRNRGTEDAWYMGSGDGTLLDHKGPLSLKIVLVNKRCTQYV